MTWRTPAGASPVIRVLSRLREVGDCWVWQGGRNRGYGQISVDRKTLYAHRIVYEAWNGPIPDGLFVLHSCDNPPCCNPGHLRVGTSTDNTADSIERGRYLPLRGTLNGCARLTEDQVREIRDGHLSLTQIAEAYGIGKTQAWRIKTRQSWQHV